MSYEPKAVALDRLYFFDRAYQNIAYRWNLGRIAISKYIEFSAEPDPDPDGDVQEYLTDAYSFLPYSEHVFTFALCHLVYLLIYISKRFSKLPSPGWCCTCSFFIAQIRSSMLEEPSGRPLEEEEAIS